MVEPVLMLTIWILPSLRVQWASLPWTTAWVKVPEMVRLVDPVEVSTMRAPLRSILAAYDMVWFCYFVFPGGMGGRL